MSSNRIKRDFSSNQIKILKLLFERDYLQNELQKALKTSAPNLHYHLSRLEGYNLIIKETLHEVGSAKINKISLNPSKREYIQKLLGYKNKKSKHNNASTVLRTSHKPSSGESKRIRDNFYRISLLILVLSLAGIITLSALFLIRVPAPINLTADADIFTQVSQTEITEIDNVELTANADIFTQVSQTEITEIENVELTADADIFTQKTKFSNINVYDGSGATPFLRLGVYEFTYDSGGYLSEIYTRFSLPRITGISSMILQLTYRTGYPIEADDYYDVNASLVSNAWVEADTTWTERPGYLGTSTLVYLHNPSLESEVYLNITSLAEGITDTLITIHLCPNNLSRVRFPAPFHSSESYGITPRLILVYEETEEPPINVYDGSGATPFLRLGLYNSTYDTGGYLSEIYVRFNLPKLENISSMLLQLTYWSGYPIEADNYYGINASLVNNAWIEADTTWIERPGYLGTSTLVFLHNPSLESEVYLNITSLIEGITETMITIHLCPNNLSRIRFPAPFESSESYGITPRLILEYKKTPELPINVYDNIGPTPFLRMGLYNSTYKMGGYLSEIYLRFNLPNVVNIRSMVLQLTYWDGYPIKTDNTYEINASLVKSNWVEETTVWTERPEYLGTSTLVYLHNPNLMSEIYLDLTNLAEGMTETLITIRLCPNNLSRIRFPAPLESSESYGITPRLILDYSTNSQSIIPDDYSLSLTGLLGFFVIIFIVSLTSIIYRKRKHKVRETPAIIKQESPVPIKIFEKRREKVIHPKFCPECGNPLKLEGLKFCPNCITPIVTERSPQTKKNIKAKKREWENLSWILLLIGSIIGLFALFNPTGSFHYGGLYSWDMWMFGYNIVYDWEVGMDIFWTLNRYLLTFSIVTTIFVVIGNIIAIVGVVRLIKKKEYAYILAGIGAVMLIGFILFYLIAYELYFVIFTGESFWGLLFPAFGVYGELIAGALMIPAFFLARKASQYSEPLEKELHQEKVYNLLKTIIETKYLPESEKIRLQNELEVVSLRLKGVASLQEKIKELTPENQNHMNLDDSLKYFQQAFELSSSSHQNISKVDLHLVEQIIEEQDKNKVLKYLSEITSHTTLLLGEIVKILS